MSAIIHDNFKIKTLKYFIDSLGTDSLYLAIARPQYWDVVAENDYVIPTPYNTVEGILRDWEDVTSLKRIFASSTSFGIFKEMWTPNVKYDTYRHDWGGTIPSVYNGANASQTLPQSLGDVKCVVITASYDIYLCLKQKVTNGEVQPSLYSPDTGTPIGTDTGIVKTSDGYYWKYLGATSTNDVISFSSKYYHPITTVPSAPGPSDAYFPQWESQENSKLLKGGIYIINVLVKGTGYNGGVAGTRNVTNAETDAEFKVIGNGTGLQFTVTYSSGGSIDDVEVTNPGTGYTHAEVVLTTGTAAEIEIIFTPSSGLGVDPIKDVVGRFLILNVTLTGAEGSGDFTIENEYRKILLISNPTNYGGSTVSTAATLDATTTFNVGTGLGVGAYPIDAIITGATTGCVARVVDFDETLGNLRIIRTIAENLGEASANNDFQVGEALNSTPGTAGGTIVSITTSEVQPNSGDIIYSEYRAPIARSLEQTESLNLIVKF